MKPDKVVFVDYRPCASNFIQFFDLHPELKKSEIIIHLYGDFTLNSPVWKQCSEILKEYKVKFICASKEQYDFVGQMVTNKQAVLSWVPFPVDTNFFRVSKTNESTLRLKHNIAEGEFVFIYTGRVSRQKNVLELVELFLRFQKLLNTKMHLLIAGPFDNIGVSYIGRHFVNESYPYKFNKLINKQESVNVIYLGNLCQEGLKSYYNLADCYVSLAAHNDEDFGMAPAEAICCGLPLLLSDWGGFKSFHRAFSEFCHLIPIKESDGRLVPVSKMAQKGMFESLAKNIKKEKSKKIQERAHSTFSVENVSKRLQGIFSSKGEKFEGFTGDFFSLANIIEARGDKPFLSDKYSPFYYKIYRPYLSKFGSQDDC